MVMVVSLPLFPSPSFSPPTPPIRRLFGWPSLALLSPESRTLLSIPPQTAPQFPGLAPHPTQAQQGGSGWAGLVPSQLDMRGHAC